MARQKQKARMKKTKTAAAGVEVKEEPGDPAVKQEPAVKEEGDARGRQRWRPVAPPPKKRRTGRPDPERVKARVVELREIGR